MQHDFEDHEIKFHTHQLYYNSIFISLYSFLEKKMNQLCKLAEKENILKLNDLNGNGVIKYYNYITKVLLIDLNTVEDEWELIKKYNKLRNQLVHSPVNTIDNKNSNLITIFKSIANLNYKERENSFTFEIADKQLLLDFKKAINSFLHEVFYERIKH
ncbi:hypothetical protein BZG02_16315 [Labilibaculum filiforme]|uniref:Uncharacterized protein n=2 Tax=Labilibaculum filiforme TaxID=1940526 RepID=A0A2N3HTI2_9BACT|nr:hypothetical protein BZG02_16315 [Labilibaculum filiforme]